MTVRGFAVSGLKDRADKTRKAWAYAFANSTTRMWGRTLRTESLDRSNARDCLQSCGYFGKWTSVLWARTQLHRQNARTQKTSTPAFGTDPKKWEFNKNTLGLPSPVFNRRQVVQFLLDSIFIIIFDVIFYNLNYNRRWSYYFIFYVESFAL